MAYLRIQIKDPQWRDTWWGNTTDPTRSSSNGAPTCRLDSRRAKIGLREARRRFPEKRFMIKRYDNGMPDNEPDPEYEE